jgi:hypothetical protein
MDGEPYNYRDFFHTGQRARVELPLLDGSYNGGAVITAVEDACIALRLGSEEFPEGLLLHQEAPLLVRVGKGGASYSCRGRVLNERPGDELMVQLVDQVTTEDLRDFFRLDTQVPATLFNVTTGTTEETGSGISGQAGERAPRIVNISGGGFRTETRMPMNFGDVVYATFLLPLPEPQAVAVVAQVMHSEMIDEIDGGVCSAGCTFMHINDKDRDAIVRYVCDEEIKRIRLCRETFFTVPKS